MTLLALTDSETTGLVSERTTGLHWTELTVQCGDSTLFRDDDGGIAASTTVAILGRSGAGKTTFLEALSLKTESGLHRSGTVTWNSDPLTEAWVRQHVSHVGVKDVLCPTLTVEETCQYYAALTVGDPIPVLRTLGLEAALAPRFVGALSTGERKRLQVAVSMLASPTLLCLDEPTSGLSDPDALALVSELKRINSDTGTTVVLVIHQPRKAIVDQFDRILLLQAGTIVVDASPSDVEARFASVCPIGENVVAYVLDHLHQVTDASLRRPKQDQSLGSASKARVGWRLSPKIDPAWWGITWAILRKDVATNRHNYASYVQTFGFAFTGIALFGALFSRPIAIMRTVDPDSVSYLTRLYVFFGLAIMFDNMTKFKSVELNASKREFQHSQYHCLLNASQYVLGTVVYDTIFLLLPATALTLMLQLVGGFPFQPSIVAAWIGLIWAFLWIVAIGARWITFAAQPTMQLNLFGLLNFVVLGFNGIMLPIEFLYPSIQWIASINPLYHAYEAMERARDVGGEPSTTLGHHLAILLGMGLVALLGFGLQCSRMRTWPGR